MQVGLCSVVDTILYLACLKQVVCSKKSNSVLCLLFMFIMDIGRESNVSQFKQGLKSPLSNVVNSVSLLSSHYKPHPFVPGEHSMHAIMY